MRHRVRHIDPGVRPLLLITALAIFIIPIGLIGLFFQESRQEVVSTPCFGVPSDIATFAPPGVFEFEVNTSIRNCGNAAWKQGEYQVNVLEGDTTIFISPLNLPKASGGKHAQLRLPVSIPRSATQGTRYTVVYQITRRDGGGIGNQFRLTITVS